jgi:hypothetical protein
MDEIFQSNNHIAAAIHSAVLPVKGIHRVVTVSLVNSV